MNPITSQRGRKRAEQEKAFVLRQLEELKKKRSAAMAGFDMTEAHLGEQLSGIEKAISDYDNPPQKTLKGVGGES